MSYVVSIRRADSQPPYAREELERIAHTQTGVQLERGVLAWSNGNGEHVELFIGKRELRADHIPSGLREQALEALQGIARELNARLVGEEGEDITFDAMLADAPAPGRNAVLGAVLAAIALPLMLVLALVRLPWVVWRIGRRLK